MNKIITTGRVASDIELKNVNGRNCANFRFASNNKRKDENGQYGTNFYRVTCWGAVADVASKYLKKGHRANVAGDLTIRDYVGTDGAKRISVEIDNAEVDLVETKAEAEAKGGSAPATAAPTTPPVFTTVETDDSELPF